MRYVVSGDTEARPGEKEVRSAPTYPSNPGAVPGEGPPLREAEESGGRAGERAQQQ